MKGTDRRGFFFTEFVSTSIVCSVPFKDLLGDFWRAIPAFESRWRSLCPDVALAGGELVEQLLGILELCRSMRIVQIRALYMFDKMHKWMASTLPYPFFCKCLCFLISGGFVAALPRNEDPLIEVACGDGWNVQQIGADLCVANARYNASLEVIDLVSPNSSMVALIHRPSSTGAAACSGVAWL